MGVVSPDVPAPTLDLPSWEFHVLGAVEALSGGRPVPIAGVARSLLAVLLTVPARVIGIDEIIAGLWGENVPSGARKAVQSYVSRLRQTLKAHGHDSSLVVTQAPGYLLAVAPESIDSVRFEQYVNQARRAAQTSSWPVVHNKATTALSLWRGEPFEEFADLPFAQMPTIRLTELHLSAIELRIDADIELGAGSEVVMELEELVVRHPHRERLWGQLMLALYRAGRQGDALGAYRRARDLLMEQVGVEPGPELRELEHAVLIQDPALHRPSGLPRPIGPNRNESPPRQLPTRTPHFVGREAELKQIDGVLAATAPPAAGTTVVVIDGTAGVGKTTLAVHWAHHVAHRYPDGQLYVNLRGFDPSDMPMSPLEAVRGFLAALAIPPERVPAGLEAQSALYRSILADRRMLVVLDNARDDTQVRPLLPGHQNCLVVVTSRTRLSGLVAKEGAHLTTLDPLTTAEAEMFLSRRLDPWRVAAEPASVAELIDRCARLPLALAIVATRAAVNQHFLLSDLAEELRHEQSRLDALDTVDPSASIRTVFSWSYQCLRPLAAGIFRLLTVHPGPEISSRTCASLAGISPQQAKAALNELTRAHLVEEYSLDRFTFHDLLRAYATDQALAYDSPVDRSAASRRLLDHFLQTSHLADRLLNPIRDPVIPPPPSPGTTPEKFAGYTEALAWFEAERPALLRIVTQAATQGFDHHAWQLAWTIETFLDRRGYWDNLAAVAKIALDATVRLANREGQARAHGLLGRAQAWLGSDETAQTHLQQALHLFEEVQDVANQALTHRALAWVCERQHRPDHALGHAQQALSLYRVTGREDGEARALNSVGWYHALLGHPRKALALCEQALTLHRQLGNIDGEAHTWDSLGYAHHHLGHYDRAGDCYRNAIERFQQLGDRYYEAVLLTRLGDTHDAAARTNAARQAWRQALILLDNMRHPDADRLRIKLAPNHERFR